MKTSSQARYAPTDAVRAAVAAATLTVTACFGAAFALSDFPSGEAEGAVTAGGR